MREGRGRLKYLAMYFSERNFGFSGLFRRTVHHTETRDLFERACLDADWPQQPRLLECATWHRPLAFGNEEGGAWKVSVVRGLFNSGQLLRGLP